MKSLLLIIVAYLLGSVPFGDVIARVKGIDLTKVGSGNIGATNVLRSVGRMAAILTLIGDIMKGSLAVAAAKYLVNDPVVEGIVGLAAIVGHDFSIFLRLKGGKGVATSIGVLLVYSPKAAVFTILLWLTVVVISRYSSLGALVAFGLLPVAILVADPVRSKVIISVCIAVLVVLKHEANIRRLIKGIEPRVGEKV
ncbi:MAG TPA: glycerol-3-phosphate 1-O-acyltransferase PlsY [Thermodesulfovibrionales bacterium]|nr:glycerol-3-phosphate 1-O-acyltransferase PlsY [Thermodesulfovibrionales bacterium]